MLVLTACGGSSGGPESASSTQPAGNDALAAVGQNTVAVTPPVIIGTSSTSTGSGSSGSAQPASLVASTSQRDAVRLANQASFGPTEALVADMRAKGREAWVMEQLSLTGRSSYRSGGSGAVHQNTTQSDFCALSPQNADPNLCWRDWYSERPLVWDFYNNVLSNADQLRQRTAFALQQIVVVSAHTVGGTYGLRNYQNRLLALALGNYRDVLRAVALSPVMGDFLNGVNNHKDAPNENFARELLQLFALGSCRLNSDGSLIGGSCQPVYDNALVRNYAYALTGWTYPPGGRSYWPCSDQGWNCRYYGADENADMVSVPANHDAVARTLLSNVTVPASRTPEQALDKVLDSLMAHPNMAPFISRQLIQHLVTSNPSGGYVQRVAAAFSAGRYAVSPEVSVGSGRKGDLAATVAAILLDAEARRAAPVNPDGKLRDPVLAMTSALRALNATVQGETLVWPGYQMQQPLFNAPSVFNFFPPDYPVPGQPGLVGPSFGVLGASTGLARLNFLSFLPWASRTSAQQYGLQLNLSPYLSDAGQPEALVDRLSNLLIGAPLPSAARSKVVAAVAGVDHWWGADWQQIRVERAAFLVLASPQAQVMR